MFHQLNTHQRLRVGLSSRNVRALQNLGSGFQDPNAGGPIGRGYDPEGLLKKTPMSTGLIESNLAKRELSEKKKEAAAAAQTEEEKQKEIEERRAGRHPPTETADLVEYFLQTVSEDMEFEISRCRPLLTKAFFAELDTMVGNVRFAAKPDEERLVELEGLRDYLKEGVKKWDTTVEKIKTQGMQKLKRVLGSQDPHNTLLEMAADNEIDYGFLVLMQSNIDSARNAGNEQAAEFIEKIYKMAYKFAVAEVEQKQAEEAAEGGEGSEDGAIEVVPEGQAKDGQEAGEKQVPTGGS